MKSLAYGLLALFFITSTAIRVKEVADPTTYLADIKVELEKTWPDNRAINIVFHGHSVPAGYFATPHVNTLEAYPQQLLKHLKAQYPTAVINVITTAIGGEHAVLGAKRFSTEVLPHRPDVLFIDYSLNDRGIGLEKAYEAWDSMITKALEEDIKVILMTPSPDLTVNILEPDNILEQHRNQVEQLATKHGVGLVDSYALFKAKVMAGDTLAHYMSQSNHPNAKGHALIAEGIFQYFE